MRAAAWTLATWFGCGLSPGAPGTVGSAAAVLIAGVIIYHLHWHFLQEHVGPGIEVLDAGCGAGRFSLAMAETGSAVTCLDLSAEQLRIARVKVGEAGMAARSRVAYAMGSHDRSAVR